MSRAGRLGREQTPRKHLLEDVVGVEEVDEEEEDEDEDEDEEEDEVRSRREGK